LLNVASPAALVSAVALVVNQLIWFRQLPGVADELSALHLVGFFLIFSWLVPVGCVIAFSVNEGTLPRERAESKSTALFNALWNSSLESATLRSRGTRPR